MTQNSLLNLMVQAILSFVRADSWQDSKDIVMTLQNILLTDEVDYAFSVLLMHAEREDDPQAVRLLEDYHQLLHRCRVEGIEAAFAEQLGSPPSAQVLVEKLLTFVRAENRSESKADLAEHPELLSDEALAVLARLIAGQESEEARWTQMISDRPSKRINRLTGLIAALIKRDTPLYELAIQEPELLSDEVDAMLQEAIANARAQGTEKDEEWAVYFAQQHEGVRLLRHMMRGG